MSYSPERFTFVLFTSVVVACAGSNIATIKERLKRMESRLTENMSLLRQKWQDPVSPDDIARDELAQHLNNFTEGDQLLQKLEKLESELKSKVHVIQRGMQHEKRVVKSIQDALLATVKGSTLRTDLMAEFLQDMLVNISQTFTCGNILYCLKEDLWNNLKDVQTNTEPVRVSSTDIAKPGRFSDCSELLRHGHVTSGVYTIQPEILWRPLQVYCDMTTAGGGWTVFQRRQDGSENFDRLWLDYQFGFGNLDGEFWMGNEFIHRLTSRAPHELE